VESLLASGASSPGFLDEPGQTAVVLRSSPPHRRSADTLERLNELPDLCLHSAQLTLRGRHAGTRRHPQAIHLASELMAELLEQVASEQSRAVGCEFVVLIESVKA